MIHIRSYTAAISFLFLFGAARIASQTPQATLPDAAALLDRVDAERVRGATAEVIHGMEMKGRCRLQLQRRGKKKQGKASEWGEFREQVDTSGNFRTRATYPGFGSFEKGMVDGMGWERDPTVGVRAIDGSTVVDFQRMLRRLMGSAWRKEYRSVKTVGEESLDERPHWIIEAVPHKGSQHKLWIDKANHRQTKVAGTRVTPAGKEPYSQVVRRFQRVDGRLYPFSYSVTYSFLMLQFEAQSLEHKKFGADTFVVPKDVQQKLKEQEDRSAAAEAIASSVSFADHEIEHTVVIRARVRGTEIGQKLAIILPEVLGYLNKIGVRSEKPPFNRWKQNGEFIDIEAGFIVPKKVDGMGRIKASVLPAGRVATTVHVGPYDRLPETWQKIDKRLAMQKLEPADAGWEVYLTDPGRVRDPRNWQTKCYVPVKRIVRIRQMRETHVASIRQKVKPNEIAKAMAIMMPEVYMHAVKVGRKPKEQPFSRFHSISDEEIDIEAGIRLDRPIEKAGRIESRTLPGGKAVMTWHVGHYHKMEEAWKFVLNWVQQRPDLKQIGAPWEIYITDPGQEKDPSKWLTQIFVPVEIVK